MKTFARDVPRGTTIRKDICIIGAGAAGIAIAREFNNYQNVSLALLESGHLEFSKKVQDLYEGSLETNALRKRLVKSYLVDSRRRYFGGSTNCWAGWTIPLHGWDFKNRPWVADSGWPITLADLEPYYRRALPLLGVTSFDYDLGEKEEALGPEILSRSERVVTRTMHKKRSPPRFGELFRDEIVRSPNVELFLGATAVDLRAGSDRTGIGQVEVASLEGNRFRVAADFVLLCAGGIENARLLLASSKDFPDGIGNEHDLVGRYFMEHFGLNHIAKLFLSHPERRLGMYYNRYITSRKLPRVYAEFGHLVSGTLALSEQVQEREQLLGCLFYLTQSDRHRRQKVPQRTVNLFRVMSRIDNYPREVRVRQRGAVYFGGLGCQAEMSPDPENRVTLTGETDSLGLPRVRLNWNISEREWDSVRRSLVILSREMGRWSEGRLRVVMSSSLEEHSSHGAKHHMGTTRMHADPARGVVDRNCRVHSLSNLYIGGSSVFPAGSCVNPTFTLVALALRLAEHLKGKL